MRGPATCNAMDGEIMLLFRIEDTFYQDRAHNAIDSNPLSICMNKTRIDTEIAEMIRKAVNGAKDRRLLSYSRSLGVCLLKYNKYADNALLFFDELGELDSIHYISHKGNKKRKYYSVDSRWIDTPAPLFNKTGTITLTNLIVDVSDNKRLDDYLQRYTGSGLKKYASPEKDCEVLVMNPPETVDVSQNPLDVQYVVQEYISAVYVLYALQKKYRFLDDEDIYDSLMKKLSKMEGERFENPDEKIALLYLVHYLKEHWENESKSSQKIYEYPKKSNCFSLYYDSIQQFQDILTNDFDESLFLSEYNDNIVSELFWEYCDKFLSHKI